MKNLTLFCFFATAVNAFSQLTVHAGDDTTICVTWNSTGNLSLGGNPTASGGVGPYSYVWECNYNYTVGSNTYLLTASDFLSDTTIANPNLIHTVSSPVTFTLLVSDASGQVESDTIVVSFSIFNTHIHEYNHSMMLGDSVQFVSVPNISGGTPPLSYLWQPNHGLADSLSYSNFWVKPTVNTSYYLTVTDAIGCVVSASPVFHVYVGYVNLSALEVENTLLFPNPTNGQLYLKNNGANLKRITIYNPEGRLIDAYTPEKSDEIDVSTYSNGIYKVVLDFEHQTKTLQIVKGNN